MSEPDWRGFKESKPPQAPAEGGEKKTWKCYGCGADWATEDGATACLHNGANWPGLIQSLRAQLAEEIEYSKQTKKDFEEAHTKLLDTRAEKKIAVDCGLQLADERDQLRAENARLTSAMNAYSNDEILAKTEIQKVEAENARLRGEIAELKTAIENK